MERIRRGLWHARLVNTRLHSIRNIREIENPGYAVQATVRALHCAAAGEVSASDGQVSLMCKRQAPVESASVLCAVSCSVLLVLTKLSSILENYLGPLYGPGLPALTADIHPGLV